MNVRNRNPSGVFFRHSSGVFGEFLPPLTTRIIFDGVRSIAWIMRRLSPGPEVWDGYDQTTGERVGRRKRPVTDPTLWGEPRGLTTTANNQTSWADGFSRSFFNRTQVSTTPLFRWRLGSSEVLQTPEIPINIANSVRVSWPGETQFRRYTGTEWFDIDLLTGDILDTGPIAGNSGFVSTAILSAESIRIRSRYASGPQYWTITPVDDDGDPIGDEIPMLNAQQFPTPRPELIRPSGRILVRGFTTGFGSPNQLAVWPHTVVNIDGDVLWHYPEDWPIGQSIVSDDDENLPLRTVAAASDDYVILNPRPTPAPQNYTVIKQSTGDSWNVPLPAVSISTAWNRVFRWPTSSTLVVYDADTGDVVWTAT